jgi:hypothetical protein
MATNEANPLNPTYQGYVNSTIDSLPLFDAYLCGYLNHLPRPPHDRELQDMIKSSNILSTRDTFQEFGAAPMASPGVQAVSSAVS